jgi:hypothetical protein
LIWVGEETEIFLEMGLDRQITDLPVRQNRCSRSYSGDPHADRNSTALPNRFFAMLMATAPDRPRFEFKVAPA